MNLQNLVSHWSTTMRDAASKALFETKLPIPADRIQHYEKNWGVQIAKIDGNSNEPLPLCKVCWSNVFPEGLDPMQSFFINGIVSQSPKVKTFGQHLYIVAIREAIRQGVY